MSTRFFPTVANVVSGLRRAFFLYRSNSEYSKGQCKGAIDLAALFGFASLLLLSLFTVLPGMLSSAQDNRLPNFSNCGNYDRASGQLEKMRLRLSRSEGHDGCAKGTVYKQSPTPRTIVKRGDTVILYVSLGPQTPPITPAPITPAPITPAPITPAPITPAPVTPAPITPTESPTASPTPSPTPTPYVGPDISDVLPWVLPPVILLPGAVLTTRALRRRKWRRLIDVDASINQPSTVRMTPLNRPSEPVEMNVQILPGDIRFAGPIKVTRKRGDE